VTALVTRSVVAGATLLLLAGCVSSTKKRVPFDYSAYVASDPRSVLVAPVVGLATPKERNYFLATITEPLAERGYYVFPVRMSKELEAEAGFSGGPPPRVPGKRDSRRGRPSSRRSSAPTPCCSSGSWAGVTTSRDWINLSRMRSTGRGPIPWESSTT
jgi:hypothetical protein